MNMTMDNCQIAYTIIDNANAVGFDVINPYMKHITYIDTRVPFLWIDGVCPSGYDDCTHVVLALDGNTLWVPANNGLHVMLTNMRIFRNEKFVYHGVCSCKWELDICEAIMHDVAQVEHNWDSILRLLETNLLKKIQGKVEILDKKLDKINKILKYKHEDKR